MQWLTGLSLISGPLPILLTVAGAGGGIWLLAGRTRWFTHRAIPLCAGGVLVVTGALYCVVEWVWRPFPDPIALNIYGWIGLGLCAMTLLVPRMVAAGGVVARLISVLAALAVVLVAAVKVNLVFAAYPTVGTVIGIRGGNRIDFRSVPPPSSRLVSGVPLDAAWTPPPHLPSAGKVVTVDISGTASRFNARDAEIYLPPAYFADPRPQLPVLVLLAGQPGEPEDWLAGGRLADTMDRFARSHDGLAAVVVVADATGSRLANPLCMDSRLGNVATYLALDVPDWIKANLQVNPDPMAWAVGGLSYGGTCALQMATNYPQLYPTFLDFSGAQEPTLGDRRRTVAAAFGGDMAAFAKVNPLDLMATRKYPRSAGVFVVGSGDNGVKPGAHTVYQAAKDAGMDVQYVEVPGRHSFAVWSAGLAIEMDWLARRLGLIS